MPWLFLLFAFGALALAFSANSILLAIVALLAALVLLVIGVLGLLAQRVGSQSRSEAMMVDPAELRRLREQAEARRTASETAAASDSPPPPGF